SNFYILSFFFFSSRRRHTRCYRDWSSDVCSSVACSAGEADQDNARTFSFTYEAEVPAQPAGTGPIDVFIPLAVSDAHQAILRRDVKASIPGRETIESRYGNKFWHGHVDRSDGKPITVVLDYITQRRVL